MKNCMPLWREAHGKIKMFKAPYASATFSSLDIEKLHGVVAPSIFSSQNAQNTAGVEHFLKFRY